MIMGSPKGFLDQRMDLFSGYFWIFLSKLVQTLFWVFTKIFVRFFTHEAINSACSSNLRHENYKNDSRSSKDRELKSERFGEGTDTIQQEYKQIDSNSCEPEAEQKEDFSSDTDNLYLEEEGTTKLVFKFKYQTWNNSEEFKGSNSESFDFVNTDNKASTRTSKYEFISCKSFSQEFQKASNFTSKELYVHSEDFSMENDAINDSDFSSERKFMIENCERRCVDAAEKVKVKAVPSIEQLDTVKDQMENNMNNHTSVKEISAEDNFLYEDDFICLSFELDSISSIGDGFLSDTDLGITIELDTLGNHDKESARLTKEDLNFDDEDRDTMLELRKLEGSRLKNSDMETTEKLTGHCFQDRQSIISKPEESVKPNSHSLTSSELEDSNRFDTLWEHQELIEQLKMELKKVKATGLPTIFENSESPRIMEDLKPWNIEEQLLHGSTINELPKFYRSYRERMRKLDILNYQKMYAIGSFQSKDPLQSFSSRENSSPAITSFLPHSFRLSRRKKSESDTDPMKKFKREFYSDLEMVYVGQLCLSWEFLQWEYEKALELWESDQYRLQRYNEVAGEFQQFQVLLQRFIENEPFQGPRVENYARNRCVMLNLLQVPIIREDNANDKKKFREIEADKDAIPSDMLVEILEESIRTIWRFIRADKDASSLNHKGPRETQVELQDPADSELVVEIQAELQKKEKRLREFLKSRSSILKKFQKHEEDGKDHFLYFFSQVDMKLVWRVLNMSRITRDQLAWCRGKLNKVNFVNKRIHIEPSFLLFPC